MSKEHDEALDKARTFILQLLTGHSHDPEAVLQLAQAYEALCTGAAMVRPTNE